MSVRKAIGFTLRPGMASSEWTSVFSGEGEVHEFQGGWVEGVGPWRHQANWVETDDGMLYCDGGCGFGGEAIYAPIHTCPSCGHSYTDE